MENHLQIKVCGMRNAENIAQVAGLQPQYMGFIFYPASKRFVGDDFNANIVERIDREIKKIGVFVNSNIDEVLQKVNDYKLNGVQLHGEESVAYCSKIRKKLNAETLVIKVFLVDEAFDFSVCSAFATVCDYFLFDTKTKKYGGSGKSFDWKILQHYPLNKPFFLSGGIKVEDAKMLNKLAAGLPQLYAVDINSCFEVAPAMKNIDLIEKFIKEINT